MRRGLTMIATGLLLALGSARAQAPAVPEGFRAEPGDMLVHAASGIAFPARVAGFKRVFEDSIGGPGRDVVVAYVDDGFGSPIIARIALLKIAMLTPHEHFIALKSLVGSYFKDPYTDVVPLADGPFDLPERHLKGWQGHFSAKRNGEPYTLSLTTIHDGPWSARMTAAYPTAVAEMARKRLLDLAVALPLPDAPAS